MRENLNREELQKAYLLYGKNFHVFLGVTYAQARKFIKENELLEPVNYVRKMINERPAEFLSEIRKFGSLKKVAKFYSVSESFLRTNMPGQTSTYIPNPGNFEAELKRLGSVALAARVWNCSESDIREQAKTCNIDIAAIISWADTGFANAKGRKAELYFAEVRGSKILKDFNTENNQSPNDYEDLDLKLVNVKSSQRWAYSSRKRFSYKHYWKFSMESAEKSDTIAFVLMDERYENVIDWFVAHSDWIADNISTVIVNELALSKIKERDGCRYMDWEDFETYVLLGKYAELAPVSLRR